jgi:hypothetical protein
MPFGNDVPECAALLPGYKLRFHFDSPLGM